MHSLLPLLAAQIAPRLQPLPSLGDYAVRKKAGDCVSDYANAEFGIIFQLSLFGGLAAGHRRCGALERW